MVSRSPKSLHLIATTWKMQDVKASLARRNTPRMDTIRKAAAAECVDACGGEWLECALQVLRKNGLHPIVFAEAVRDLLVNGRGKLRKPRSVIAITYFRVEKVGCKSYFFRYFLLPCFLLPITVFPIAVFPISYYLLPITVFPIAVCPISYYLLPITVFPIAVFPGGPLPITVFPISVFPGGLFPITYILPCFLLLCSLAGHYLLPITVFPIAVFPGGLFPITYYRVTY